MMVQVLLCNNALNCSLRCCEVLLSHMERCQVSRMLMSAEGKCMHPCQRIRRTSST
jgi:hypothetical protein